MTSKIRTNAQHGEASFDFGISLLKALTFNGQTNSSSSTVLSPFSVLGVLSQLNLGAKNKTAEEIAKIFEQGKTAEEIAEYYGSITASFQKKEQDPENIFEAVNKVYYESGYSLFPEFKSVGERYFGENCFEALNIAKAEAAAKTINDFVSNATHHKITNIISPEDLQNQEIPIILINAVYFLAQWDLPFDGKATKERPFFASEGNSTQIQQMRNTDDFGYFEDEQVKVLRMGYKRGDAFMYLILPTERFGLDKMLQMVDGKTILNWVENAGRKTEVFVQLPKFTIESTHSNLDVALKSIGLKTMFDRTAADFSGISGGQLWVDRTVQKAFIKIDEEGTEAAAVMYIGMVGCCPEQEPPKEFIADHPFLYAVVDKQSNLLFVGIFRGN